jgi:hypothetical protein
MGNASAKDREEFKDWISGSKPTSPIPASLVVEDGFLTAAALEEIDGIMKARGMKDADLMEKLKLSRHDSSLGRAKPGPSRWKTEEGISGCTGAFSPGSSHLRRAPVRKLTVQSQPRGEGSSFLPAPTLHCEEILPTHRMRLAT